MSDIYLFSPGKFKLSRFLTKCFGTSLILALSLGWGQLAMAQPATVTLKAASDLQEFFSGKDGAAGDDNAKGGKGGLMGAPDALTGGQGGAGSASANGYGAGGGGGGAARVYEGMVYTTLSAAISGGVGGAGGLGKDPAHQGGGGGGGAGVVTLGGGCLVVGNTITGGNAGAGSLPSANIPAGGAGGGMRPGELSAGGSGLMLVTSPRTQDFTEVLVNANITGGTGGKLGGHGIDSQMGSSIISIAPGVAVSGGSSSIFGGAGVYLLQGSVDNLGIISGGAVLTGPGSGGTGLVVGARANATSNIHNQAVIAGGNSVSGAKGGQGAELRSANLVNDGIITGGTAQAASSKGGSGLIALDSYILNNASGQIQGGNGAAKGGNGLEMQGGNELVNYGVISAGSNTATDLNLAVVFNEGSNKATLHQGASFKGGVLFGDDSEGGELYLHGGEITAASGGNAIASTSNSYKSLVWVGGGVELDGAVKLQGTDDRLIFDYSRGTANFNFENGGMASAPNLEFVFANVAAGYYDFLINSDTTFTTSHSDVEVHPSVAGNYYYKKLNSTSQNLLFWAGSDNDNWGGTGSAWSTQISGGASGEWGTATTSSKSNVLVFNTAGAPTVKVNGIYNFEVLQFKADTLLAQDSGGALYITPAGSSSTGYINVEHADNTAAISAKIGGSGMGLSKIGEGKLVLSNVDNDYNGLTSVVNGVLELNSTNAQDNNAKILGSGNVLLNGGSLRLASSRNAEFASSREFKIGPDNGVIDVAGANDNLTIKGVISDLDANSPGKLVKTGDGYLDIEGANSFSGGLDIKGGEVVAYTATAAGSGPIAVDSGATMSFELSAPGTVSNAISGAGWLDVYASETTFSADLIQVDNVYVEADAIFEKVLQASSIEVDDDTLLSVNTLRLGAGQSLDNFETNSSGQFSFETLEIEGLGNSGKRLTDDFVTYLNSGNRLNGKTISFIVTPAAVAQNSAMLTSTDPLNISGSTLALSASKDLPALKVGQSVALLEKSSGTPVNINSSLTVGQGATSYTFLPQIDGSTGKLEVVLQKAALSDSGTHAYLQSGSAGLHTLSQSGMRLITDGSQAMTEATFGDYELGESYFGIMATVGGGFYKEKTGSHVDVDSFSALSGPVWRFDNAAGSTRLSAFVEGGWGSYDTSNSFSSGSVKGDGDIYHYGLGLMARHDFLSGFHAEASVRFGRVNTEFSSNDMVDGDFDDLESNYYGAHLGLGYAWQLGERDVLDTYAQLLWTRQEGDSVSNDTGERVKIKDADSISHRLGARYTHEFSDQVSAFVGLAWEHEYDSKVEGSLNGLRIKPSQADGSSAYGELGVTFTPQDSNWNFTLKAHGNMGQREGGGGSLQFGYKF